MAAGCGAGNGIIDGIMRTPTSLNRRQWLAVSAAPALAVASTPDWVTAVLRRHDELVESLLRRQITDPGNRHSGGVPNDHELCEPGAAAGLVEACMAALLHPGSRHHRSGLLGERIRLAAAFLERAQNAEGNIDLLITNFNSPPDTGFVCHPLATACLLARRAGERSLEGLLAGFLSRAGAALARGGVHTPNHRWVICQALAQIHELYPDPSYIRRIDQWLAEGIDIDEDGQYTERSTLIYNRVTNRAFIVMAEKLRRPELLAPVRRNLEAMLYLLHPDDELVTEISRRQDQYQRGSAGVHWFALKFLALREAEGRFAALAARHAAEHARLAELMEYPELREPGPAPVEPSTDYERLMPALSIMRYRRGPISATAILQGDGRLFTLRHGATELRALRMAASFFGKGQFIPQAWEREGAVFRLRQELEGPYFQPLNPPEKVTTENWSATRARRQRSEICRLQYQAEIAAGETGFSLRLQARGTRGVPLAVELNFCGNPPLEGCAPHSAIKDAYLAQGGTILVGPRGEAIRISPTRREHAYVAIRGAHPKLPGPSVFLTAFTPFDETLRIECV